MGHGKSQPNSFPLGFSERVRLVRLQWDTPGFLCFFGLFQMLIARLRLMFMGPAHRGRHYSALKVKRPLVEKKKIHQNTIER